MQKKQNSKYAVYRITVSGEVYIGVSRNPTKRERDHLKDARRGSYNDLHKALRDSDFIYDFSILEWCDSQEEVFRREIEIIQEYDSFRNGLNMSSGADGFYSKTLEELWRTDEFRQKVIKSLKSYYKDPENLAKVTAQNRERTSDPEFKERQRQEAIRLFQDEGFRRKYEEGMRKRKNPEGKNWTKEERIKFQNMTHVRELKSQRMKELHRDPKFKEKIRKSNAEQMKDPLKRNRLGNQMKRKVKDEFGREFESLREAARFHNLSYPEVSKILNGTRKKPKVKFFYIY